MFGIYFVPLQAKEEGKMNHREYILQSIKVRAKEVLPKNGKAILFGSQARGDYREDSDWDLLLLLDKPKLSPTDFDEYAYPFFELGWQLDAEIHPLLYTVTDWEKRRGMMLYKDVRKEGRTL